VGDKVLKGSVGCTAGGLAGILAARFAGLVTSEVREGAAGEMLLVITGDSGILGLVTSEVK